VGGKDGRKEGRKEGRKIEVRYSENFVDGSLEIFGGGGDGDDYGS
jgi:hypothetical protein